MTQQDQPGEAQPSELHSPAERWNEVDASAPVTLNLQEGLFRTKVTDWRAVVDCVLIDTDYQGEVFNVCLADVPERKQDLVQGRYRLPLPAAGARVAVKIIDRLGEELLIERVP